MSEPLAHSGGHLLADHLETVAALAAEFSKAFDAADASRRWAFLAGLWHDLGKYREGFQRYVRLADNPDAHIEGKVGGRQKTQSAAGALWAGEQLNRLKQMPILRAPCGASLAPAQSTITSNLSTQYV